MTITHLFESRKIKIEFRQLVQFTTNIQLTCSRHLNDIQTLCLALRHVVLEEHAVNFT